MFKNWFKQKAKGDVTVAEARANYQKHQDDLNLERMKYIKRLCNRIKEDSRKGCTYIRTINTLNGFMTYDYMIEIKSYFEQRGFKVTEESNSSGYITSWLKISWE